MMNESRMDTPHHSSARAPRRKLKKILKKKCNLNVSSSTYQKKLKSAINVSLNSTQNVRSLRMNNKALAMQVENLKLNLRLMADAHTGLLEQNNQLGEKNIALEKLMDDPSSFIEDEVNKRFEVLMQGVRGKLKKLNVHVQGFLDNFIELSEMCSSRNSGISEASSRSLMNSSMSTLSNNISHNFGLISTAETNVSSVGISDGYSDLDVYGHNVDDGNKETGLVHEMSMIMEQSVLEPPHKFKSTANSELELESVKESDASSPNVAQVANMSSKLPKRIPKPKTARKKHSNEEMLATVAKYNSKKNMETANKFLNRQIVLSPHTDLSASVPMPNDSVNRFIDMGNSVEEFATGNVEKALNTSESEGICDTPHDREMSDKSRPVKTQSNSSELTEMLRCKRLNKDVKGKAKAEKHSLKESTAGEKWKKKRSLCISNEFDLASAYVARLEKLEKTNEKLKEADNFPETGPCDDKESTLYMVNDMELTGNVLGTSLSHENEIVFSPSTKNHEKYSTNETRNAEKSMVSTRSRESHESSMPEESTADEKVPGAVTTRMTKPGKFVFAAARKDLDGLRKNIPVVIPRARSKSKKQLAEMIENLPQDEPKTIFDFHDKTPKLNSEKQKAMSVFSISADESTLSPLQPLRKSRKFSRDDDGLQDIGMPTQSEIDTGDSESTNHEELLKGSMNENDVMTGLTRAKNLHHTRSRGTKLTSKDEAVDDLVNKAHPSPRNTGKEIVQEHEVPENFSLLLGGITYEEPMKGSPVERYAAKNRSRSRSSRTSRSRGRQKSGCTDNAEDKRKGSVSKKDSKYKEKALIRETNSHLKPENEQWTKSKSDNQNQVENSPTLDRTFNVGEKPFQSMRSRSRSRVLDSHMSPERLPVDAQESYDIHQNHEDADQIIESADYGRADCVIQSKSVSNTDVRSRGRSRRRHVSKGSLSQAVSLSESHNRSHSCTGISDRKNRSRSRNSHSDLNVENSERANGETSLHSGLSPRLRSGEGCHPNIEVMQDDDTVCPDAKKTTVSLAASVSKRSKSKKNLKSAKILKGKRLSQSLTPQRTNREKSVSPSSPLAGSPVRTKEKIVQGSPRSHLSTTEPKKKNKRQCNNSPKIGSANGSPKNIEVIEQTNSLALSNNKDSDIHKPAKVMKIVRGLPCSRSKRKPDELPDQVVSQQMDNHKVVGDEAVVKNSEPATKEKQKDSNLRRKYHKTSFSPEKENPQIHNLPNRDILSSESAVEDTLEGYCHEEIDCAKRKRYLSASIGDSLSMKASKRSQSESSSDKQDNVLLRTPAATKSTEDLQPGNVTPKVLDTMKATEKFSTEKSSHKKEDDLHIEEGASSNMDGKRRRAVSKVNYAEPTINAKLRRGDPFTSHLYKDDSLDIFKLSKNKAKKKGELRRGILGPLHNLVAKTGDKEQDFDTE